MNPKKLLYIPALALTMAATNGCKAPQELYFKQVNQFTSDSYSQTYTQVSNLKKLVSQEGKLGKDNEENPMKQYQLLAENIKEFAPVDDQGDITDKLKNKKSELEFSPRRAVDSMDIIYTLKEVSTKIDGEVENYMLITGTNLYDQDYVEIYKIALDGNKPSTDPKDWLIQTNDIKSEQSTPFVSFKELDEDYQDAVINRIDYINDIFFPYSSPAESTKILLSKEQKAQKEKEQKDSIDTKVDEPKQPSSKPEIGDYDNYSDYKKALESWEESQE